MLVFESVDVGTKAVQHFTLAGGFHDVLAGEVACVLTLERCLHGANVAEYLRDGLDVLALLEHAGASCGHICVVGENVPCTPHDVIELGEGNKVLNKR